MPKLPHCTPRKVLAALLRYGFYIHHRTGSHINLRFLDKPHLHVVIAYHNRELAPKTLKSIIIQAELTVQEFIDLL